MIYRNSLIECKSDLIELKTKFDEIELGLGIEEEDKKRVDWYYKQMKKKMDEMIGKHAYARIEETNGPRELNGVTHENFNPCILDEPETMAIY